MPARTKLRRTSGRLNLQHLKGKMKAQWRLGRCKTPFQVVRIPVHQLSLDGGRRRNAIVKPTKSAFRRTVAAVVVGDPLALIMVALMMGRMLTFVRIALFQIIGAATSRWGLGRPRTARRMPNLRQRAASGGKPSLMRRLEMHRAATKDGVRQDASDRRDGKPTSHEVPLGKDSLF
jgi:hypothetical protein